MLLSNIMPLPGRPWEDFACITNICHVSAFSRYAQCGAQDTIQGPVAAVAAQKEGICVMFDVEATFWLKSSCDFCLVFVLISDGTITRLSGAECAS